MSANTTKPTVASLSADLAALKAMIAAMSLQKPAQAAPTQTAPAAFVTKRSSPTRASAPVRVMAVVEDESRNTLSVFSSDGKTRVCRLERLPAGAKETLLVNLEMAQDEAKPVRFLAAGGFNPDTWFFDIQP